METVPYSCRHPHWTNGIVVNKNKMQEKSLHLPLRMIPLVFNCAILVNSEYQVMILWLYQDSGLDHSSDVVMNLVEKSETD